MIPFISIYLYFSRVWFFSFIFFCSLFFSAQPFSFFSLDFLVQLEDIVLGAVVLCSLFSFFSQNRLFTFWPHSCHSFHCFLFLQKNTLFLSSILMIPEALFCIVGLAVGRFFLHIFFFFFFFFRCYSSYFVQLCC